ncbi:MAG: GNAT family N-acetyltransferase [Hyphomonas sp.]|nr:GNAT family N-acetyltransferase [Hyphomonas sp.]
MPIRFKEDDVTSPEILALLKVHTDLMQALSPPGSCHFLPVEELRAPDVTVWSMWDDDVLVGCGALKELPDGTGEVKSMHTRSDLRGQGHGRRMLEHIMAEAQRRNYSALYLETGSMVGFLPARRIYEAYGFEYCAPFGDYSLDPNSVFMHRAL